MARRNFTQFPLRTPVLTSDFVVGYDSTGASEYRARVQDIVNTVQSGIAQQLSFDDNTKLLSISLGGNTISLSSLSDTEFASVSSSFAHLISSPLLLASIYQNASSNWQGTFTTVESNSASWSAGGQLNSEIRSLTGNWQGTYTTVLQNSASWISTGSTLMSGVLTGDLVITGNLTASNLALRQAVIEPGDNVTDSPSALHINLNNNLYSIPLYTVPSSPMYGQDNAAETEYQGTLDLQSGFNGGTGFEPWNIDVDSGGGIAGTYINSAASEQFGDIDTDGLAFGIEAAPPGEGAYVITERSLLAPLTKGNALSAAIAAAFRSGDKGVILYDKDDNQLYKFAITNNSYVVDNVNINWPYIGTTSIFNLVAQQTKSNEATVTLTRSPSSYIKTVTGQIAKISFYIQDTNGGSPRENLRFNSLKVYPYLPVGATWTPEADGLDVSSLTNYLSTNHVTISSATVLQDLIIYGNLSAINIQNINLTSYDVTEITTTSALQVSGTLNVIGPILSSSIDLSNLFVTNSYFRQISGSFVTDTDLTQTLLPYVKSTSTLETPTTGISAINNIVALSQATYNALTVKLPTTLYIIV
jgi:hypothetical protein